MAAVRANGKAGEPILQLAPAVKWARSKVPPPIRKHHLRMTLPLFACSFALLAPAQSKPIWPCVDYLPLWIERHDLREPCERLQVRITALLAR